MARLLLVDDSPFATKVVKAFVEDEGHEVVGVAADGAEAIEQYEEHLPELVLLDLTMPGKNGQECLSALLDRDPAARILIVSAVTAMPTITQCIKVGAKGYVLKPLKLFDRDFCLEFTAAIDNALSE